MKTLNGNPSSSNPLPTDKEFYDRGFNTDLQAEMFDNGPETEGERLGDRAMKGAAWLAGIVGLFALAVVIAAAFDLSPTPSPDKPYHARTAMQKAFISSPGAAGNANSSNAAYAFSQFGNQPVILKSITVFGIEPSNPANATAKVAAAPAKLAAKASVAKQQATTATQMSKADMDRIEKEALEVIHGDYGNNPGRAQKLGADYELVQARVNQLLHS
ncbi:MAG: hypothetical protein K2H72_00685 [Muribaculaceae bacterium]|nr:hypothetical protein [Muribaculaceae bacterium]